MYRTDVLGKEHSKNLAQEPTSSSKEPIMKHTIAILLVLVLATVGLFSAPAVDSSVLDTMKPSSINISSNVNAFAAFGVSKRKVDSDDFNSIALFQNAVKSSINTRVDMLELNKKVDVGFLSGINNTSGPIYLTISVEALVSNNNSVGLVVSPIQATLTPSENSKFGTLRNLLIQVQEKERGAAALAPAGEYTTTVTIALVTLA